MDTAQPAARAGRAGVPLRYSDRALERNIAGDLRGAIPAKGKKNFPAITQPKEFGKLLRAIWSYPGLFHTCCAFKLSALFGLRPGKFASSNGRRSISRNG